MSGIELEQWISDSLPAWLQTAAAWYIEKGDLIDDDFQKLANLCYLECNAPEKASFIQIPKGGLDKVSDIPEFRLQEISNPVGINRLAPDAPLEFGNQNLTVVYGNNGSGKSGYVRLIKHIAKARFPGELHPNVLNATGVQQQANIRTNRQDKSDPLEWKRDQPTDDPDMELLSHVHVFDSECARHYLDPLASRYEPAHLSLLGYLANTVCPSVKAYLEQMRDLHQTSKLAFPAQNYDDKYRVWYEKLGAETSEQEVKDNCRWEEEDEKQFELQKVLVAGDLTSKIEEKRKTLSKQNKFKKTITELVANLNNSFSLIECRKEYLRLNELATKKAAKVFSDQLDGVGEENWKELWRLAKQFSLQNAYPNKPYPYIEDDAVCVLCQQPVSNESTKSRLLAFEEFVEDGIAAQAKSKKVELDGLESDLKKPIDLAFLMLEAENAKLQGLDLEVIVDTLKTRQELLLLPQTVEMPEPITIPTFLEVIDPIIEQTGKEIAELDELQKGQNFEKEKLNLKRMEARKWLAERVEYIRKEIECLKEVEKYRKPIGLTNTMSITKKKAELADNIIVLQKTKSFEHQLKELGGNKISVKLEKGKARAGQIPTHPSFEGSEHKIAIQEILSEGEMRIVALAAFLADLGGEEVKSPFVFDDPISSLDADYETATAEKLVGLAKNRQVIVFTHKLTLLAALQELVKKEGIGLSLRKIESDESGAGHPLDASIEDCANVLSALNKLKDEKLSQARKADRNLREEKKQYIAKEFRKLIEKAIEDHLLDGIIKRHSNKILSQKVLRLKRINENDISFIDGLMTKYSYFEHSQPLEKPAPVLGFDELESDIESMQVWIKEFGKRNTSQSKASAA